MTNLTQCTDEELANLVAVHVMGWEWFYSPSLGKNGWFKHHEEGHYQGVKAKFDPCNDWNDMKLVIDQFGREYQKHLVWHGHRNLVDEERDWCFIIGLGTTFRWSAWDDKAGRAVCIAALKVEGMEIG